MEQRVDATAVWMVDVGDMNPNHAALIASDFASWVSLGCPLPEVEEFASFCDVILVSIPDGGLGDVLKIKHEFGLTISAAELLEGSRNLPCVMARRYPNGKASVLINRLGLIGDVLQRVELLEE